MLGDEDYADLIPWLHRAVELAPKNTRYRITLGHVLIEIKDYDAAVAVYSGFKAEQFQKYNVELV